MNSAERMRAGRLTAVVYGVLFVAAAASAGTAENDATHRFDIKPQPLDSALLEFSRQADRQVVVATTVVSAEHTPGVSGELTIADALNQLLKETALTYKLVGERTVNIIPPAGKISRTDSPPPMGRLVQADTSSASQNPQKDDDEASGPVRAAGNGRADSSADKTGEIVVTGTQIRGAAPVGSRVTTIDRQQIENSGYSSLQDLLKSRPEFSGAGVGEVLSGRTFDAAAANNNRGTALNLRGLGADSTLVLINGRRQPGGGANGAFVDISTIPAAAVERIEILPDGASALYGSDAIGGVVNFILRKQFDGAQTSLRGAGYDGGAGEIVASQLLGRTWSGGDVLLGYQYSDRDALPDSERAYTRGDLRPLGGSDYRQPRCNPGVILTATGQPAFAIPAGQNGSALTAAQLIPGGRLCENPLELFGKEISHNAFVTFSQAVGERLEFFADGRFSQRNITRNNGGFGTTLSVPSTNAYYPAGSTGNLLVGYNLGSDLGNQVWDGESRVFSGSAGVDIGLFHDWHARVTGGYGRDDEETILPGVTSQGTALSLALASNNRATAFNPFADGSNTPAAVLDAVRGVQVETGHSTDKSISAIVNGSLFELPTGAVKAALGVDYLELDIDASSAATGRATTAFETGRDILAYFGELRVPVVAAGSNIPGLHGLELSATVRSEDYSDFGGTTNEKYGLTWSVLDTLDFRATWGTSFKAPRLNQIVAIPGILSTSDRVTLLNDPTPANPANRTNSLVRIGNNKDLQPETADIWTVGLDFTLPTGPSFHASYFNVDYHNRIARGGPGGIIGQILTAASDWSMIIIRNPTADQINAVCAEGFVVGACPTVGSIGAIVDGRYRNLASVKVEGVDFAADAAFGLGGGQLRLALSGTYMLGFKQSNAEGLPEVEFVGTYGIPARLRSTASAGWQLGGWNFSGAVNYVASERDTLSTLVRNIPSWTTLDVGVGYDFQAQSGLLNGLGIAARAVNAFNKEPPFADIIGTGFDTANANLYGRILSLTLNKRW